MKEKKSGPAKSKARASKLAGAAATESNSKCSIRAGGAQRSVNVRPDGIDFRDRMYVPTLVEVPTSLDLDEYMKAKVPILDQGQEGACTGFGLATVAHYLLRTRIHVPDAGEVSPHMLYEMAKRYDEWAGVDYEGSSCRGAMKGWYKHGVCSNPGWPGGKKKGAMTDALAADSARRPLGAYFRVNHKDLVSMHSAIAEVGILYASASVHAGWQEVKADGHINPSDEIIGGHAFAIVAYDEYGFWIQNSWGDGWGRKGFCHISYADWLANGSDVWVARLGAPVRMAQAGGAGVAVVSVPFRSSSVAISDVRPHVVGIGNDGVLDPHGDIGTTEETVLEILNEDFPRITKSWKKKRLVIYAHGGLTDKDSVLKLVNDYRESMVEAECYPLAFIWQTDYWTTLRNMLSDAMRQRRPEGFLDQAKDFMLDRVDDALEPIARLATGKAEWDEMKENALLATVAANGGARLVARLVQEYLKGVEIHLVGHSAGSIFLAPLLQFMSSSGRINTGPLAGAKLDGLGMQVASCTLWAPACTVSLFKDTYLPAIESDQLKRFALFTMTDKAERDDNCARIYNKSLLYLVSHAFEAQPRIPVIRPDGEPILGMQKFISGDEAMAALFSGKRNADWITAPNGEAIGSPGASRARHHGDFDNDEATVKATLARITNKGILQGGVKFSRSPSALSQRRLAIEGAMSGLRR